MQHIAGRDWQPKSEVVFNVFDSYRKLWHTLMLSLHKWAHNGNIVSIFVYSIASLSVRIFGLWKYWIYFCEMQYHLFIYIKLYQASLILIRIGHIKIVFYMKLESKILISKNRRIVHDGLRLSIVILVVSNIVFPFTRFPHFLLVSFYILNCIFSLNSFPFVWISLVA